MKYTDPPLTIAEQLHLLKSNNLLIEDEAHVTATLTATGYFRLNNYMRYFKKGNRFIDGTTIHHINRLYEFDKSLRIHLFDALTDIEVAIKALLNNTLACNYGSHWLSEPQVFQPSFHAYQEALLVEVMAYCKNRPEESFIRKYKINYDEPDLPPTWMVTEILSFGKISLIYDNILATKDRTAISSLLNTHDNILSSWLHCLTYVRNLCAHHAKLLNRALTIKPTMPQRKKNRFLAEIDLMDVSKIYAALCCVQYLLLSISPHARFKENIIHLIDAHPDIDTATLGFTPNWLQESIWQ